MKPETKLNVKKQTRQEEKERKADREARYE